MAVDAPPQTLTDFLRSLRAVREFQRKPVPDAIVQDILEVARWSGSASNRQFGEVVVVRKPETLQALAGLGVVRVAIRVVLHGELAERPLQVVLADAPAHAQDLVVIALDGHALACSRLGTGQRSP